MSDSSTSIEMSESTESALIESMEAQIDNMQDEINKLHGTIDKLNNKIKTLQSMIKSDLIGKIFKYIQPHATCVAEHSKLRFPFVRNASYEYHFNAEK